MKPSRELDRLVAEKVMGWTELEEIKQIHLAIPQIVGVKSDQVPSPYTGYRPKFTVPEYSSDIAAAWEVVEQLIQLKKFDGEIAISRQTFTNDPPIWLVYNTYHTDSEDLGYGWTAPHAICLAALKAVGVKI